MLAWKQFIMIVIKKRDLSVSLSLKTDIVWKKWEQ